ncbi:MAG: DegV family protein, partial [Christensenellaceae bacterium]
ELAKERVRSEFDFREIIETVAGSVITGHCGRNTLGVLFIAE